MSRQSIVMAPQEIYDHFKNIKPGVLKVDRIQNIGLFKSFQDIQKLMNLPVPSTKKHRDFLLEAFMQKARETLVTQIKATDIIT